MLIRRVTLRRFRQFENFVWEPQPGINCLVGPGDSGKTTVLEAIARVTSPAPFTNDAAHARSVARRVKSGTVGHNRSRTDFSIAFGGFKQSGIGREGGSEGLRLFLESRTVVLDEAPTGSGQLA